MRFRFLSLRGGGVGGGALIPVSHSLLKHWIDLYVRNQVVLIMLGRGQAGS